MAGRLGMTGTGGADYTAFGGGFHICLHSGYHGRMDVDPNPITAMPPPQTSKSDAMQYPENTFFVVISHNKSSTSGVVPDRRHPSTPWRESTNSGWSSIEERMTQGDKICEIRRIGGLDWDQIAEIFTVSRRDIHSWVSGRPMSDADKNHLDRLYDMIRHVYRGSPGKTRLALTTRLADGNTPCDLLRKGFFEDVEFLLGPGSICPIPRLISFDPAERLGDASILPNEIIGVVNDEILIDAEMPDADQPTKSKTGREREGQ